MISSICVKFKRLKSKLFFEHSLNNNQIVIVNGEQMDGNNWNNKENVQTKMNFTALGVPSFNRKITDRGKVNLCLNSK